MLRMNRCDLSLMKPRFYPLLMCKGFLLCFHPICVFTMAEWVRHCADINVIVLSVRPIWLLIVLPKFSLTHLTIYHSGD